MTSSFEIVAPRDMCIGYRYINASFPTTSAVLWTCNGQISFMSAGGGQTEWHGEIQETYQEIKLFSDCRGKPPFTLANVLKISDDTYHGLDNNGRELTLTIIFTSLWDESMSVWRREYRCSVSNQYDCHVQVCGQCNKVTCCTCMLNVECCE